MSLDWLSFLSSRGIEYIERGPNVARGHVNIRCPFCGPDDPSHHMGIRLEDGAWGCWRDQTHRGRSPVKLIAALTGCSFREARDLADSGAPRDVPMDELAGKLAALDSEGTERAAALEWPEETRIFTRCPTGADLPIQRYLFSRGFDNPPGLSRDYDIRYARRGMWKCRVLFPLRDPGGELRGWTGRSITERSVARYRTHPMGEGARRLLWNADRAREGSTLVLVEGPFDALKLDLYGRSEGIRSVALLGVSCPPPKQERLFELASGFRRLVVLLDSAALAQAVALSSSLAFMNAEVARLPEGRKDPGALSGAQARALVRDLDRGILSS